MPVWFRCSLLDKDNFGETPLHRAAAMEEKDAMHTLVEVPAAWLYHTINSLSGACVCLCVFGCRWVLRSGPVTTSGRPHCSCR